MHEFICTYSQSDLPLIIENFGLKNNSEFSCKKSIIRSNVKGENSILKGSSIVQILNYRKGL